jgi:hypothetical protein
MAHATTVSFAETGIIDGSIKNDSHSSGITWSAVIAGAFVSAALSLILLSLGTGLGLSAVSPWSNSGLSAATISKGAILWLILMQAIGSLMGGYLAGRLRTKWAKIHSDEVYFRDTAHGFLVWAVGLVITAAFLASAAASVAGGAGRLGTAERAAGSASAPSGGLAINPNEYFVDSLLRSNPPNLGQTETALRGEVGLIFANALRTGEIPPADKTYLDEIVAARSGMKPAEADGRVTQVFAEAQQAADTARKAVAHLSLWMFLALLIGAFCASLAATFGGAQRDHVVIV